MLDLGIRAHGLLKSVKSWYRKITFKNKWIIVLWNEKHRLSVHGIDKKFGLNFILLPLGVNLFMELSINKY